MQKLETTYETAERRSLTHIQIYEHKIRDGIGWHEVNKPRLFPLKNRLSSMSSSSS
jgi:hypothetical protein